MCLFSVLALTLALGETPANPAAEQYEISYANSYLLAVTGKAGFFAFAGHEHAIAASQWTARLAFDSQGLARSSVVVVILVSELRIDSPEARQMAHLGSGPNPHDVKTIQTRMLSPEVLDASRHPTISFTTASARESGPGRLLVTGDLTIRGRTQRISVPVNYRRGTTGAYVFDGDFRIRQTDFGLKPETVAGGTVKVKDEVQIRFRISLVPVAR